MWATANPAVNMNFSTRKGAATINNDVTNGGRSAMPDNLSVCYSDLGSVHSFKLLMHWTRDEHALLEELLLKSASNGRNLNYGKAAQQLQGKSIRDVAFICQWMTKNQNGKRRIDDNGSSRKHKVTREKVAKQQAKPYSHATNRAHVLTYAPSSTSMDIDDGISDKVIGGMPGKLLEQNAHTLDQILENLSALKVHDNINLFCHTRDNIITLLNKLNNMPGIMKKMMPPLPVKLNEELAYSILS